MIERITDANEGRFKPFLSLLSYYNANTNGNTRDAIEELRNNAPLPKDAQELIDDAVVRVQRDRLVIVDDLLSEGLVYPLTNWWSVMELYWEKRSKAANARRTMDPRAQGEDAIPDLLPNRIPVFLTMADFSFGSRLLAASERAGAPLDTSMTEESTSAVNEAIEDQAINGLTPSFNGNDAPGLLNAPNAASQAYVDNEAWDAAGHSGQKIVVDVLAMMAKLRTNRMFGPYNLYINTAYGNKLNQNFGDGVTTFDYTIRERLERIVAGGRNLQVREADQLPTNRTSLVQMTRNVVDVVVGQTPSAVSWADGPGWVNNFAILSCIIVRAKDTYDGQSGICNGNTT